MENNNEVKFQPASESGKRVRDLMTQKESWEFKPLRADQSGKGAKQHMKSTARLMAWNASCHDLAYEETREVEIGAGWRVLFGGVQ